MKKKSFKLRKLNLLLNVNPVDTENTVTKDLKVYMTSFASQLPTDPHFRIIGFS